MSARETRGEEMVDRYANLVYRLAFARTRSRDAAAELAAPEPEEARLDGYLDKLPPELRAAVHLYYYEGYSTPEIAELVGKSESAVRMRLMRARRLLRGYLEDEEGGTSHVSR